MDEKLDEMESAQSAEAAAKAGVATAKAQAAASAAKVEQAQADLATAQAKVEVEQSTLERSKVFVEYMKILSPYDGVVTKCNFFRGAFIRSPDQGGIIPLLSVSRTDVMRVVVQVPDRDVPYTRAGNPAKIQIDALPGSNFAAKVSRVADAEDQQTRTMRTEVDLPNPDGTLREGMYGRVTITLDQSKPGVTIPGSALVSEADNGVSQVFVVEHGAAHSRQVRVGADNGLRTEIVDGLKPEDLVIFRHNGALADGTPVEVVNKAAAPAAK